MDGYGLASTVTPSGEGRHRKKLKKMRKTISRLKEWEMNCYLCLYDKMGKEIKVIFFVMSPLLFNGDTIEHEGICYEIRNRLYQTSDECLYIRAFS